MHTELEIQIIEPEDEKKMTSNISVWRQTFTIDQLKSEWTHIFPYSHLYISVQVVSQLGKDLKS